MPHAKVGGLSGRHASARLGQVVSFMSTSEYQAQFNPSDSSSAASRVAMSMRLE